MTAIAVIPIAPTGKRLALHPVFCFRLFLLLIFILFTPTWLNHPLFLHSYKDATPLGHYSLLRLIPITSSDVSACGDYVKSTYQSHGGRVALAFVGASEAALQISPLLAGTDAYALPVDCADIPENLVETVTRNSSDTCRVLAGMCVALKTLRFSYVAVHRLSDTFNQSHFLFDTVLPLTGLYWGRMHQHSGVPASLYRIWPRVEWPTLATPYFVISRDVAEGLCTMHSSGLPLRLFEPREYFVAIALKSLEGVVYVDESGAVFSAQV